MMVTMCRHGKLPGICAECRSRILSQRDPNHKRVEPRAGEARAFYVYENWVAKGHVVARVHRGECSSCNDGEGIHAGSSALNGTWHGPFDSWKEADEHAASKARDARRCEKCGTNST